MEANPKQPDHERIHWLADVKLVYRLGGIERSRNVNVLVRTINPYINQQSLGEIQKQAQIQAMEFNKVPKKAEIIDVIISVSMLGTMTHAQFTGIDPSQMEVQLDQDSSTS